MLKKEFPLLGSFLFLLSACQGATPTPEPAAALTATASQAATDTPQPTATATPIPSPTFFTKIDRHPFPERRSPVKLYALPSPVPEPAGPWRLNMPLDLREYNLSDLDLRNSLEALLFSDFDDRTVWPAADRMPEGFDPQQIMDLGKNPGLGVRSLHQEGITGKHIGIAIIDTILLVDHQEYLAQLRLYEEQSPIGSPSMHGGAVASIAVGKTVGVAPDADLYYIAGDFCPAANTMPVDFACLAKAVRRIVEVNRELPPDRKIRVLSMSIGWDSTSTGYAEIRAAVQEARAAGIFLVCTSEEEMAGYPFHGLDRPPLSDPDAFDSYEPGIWWSKYWWQWPGLSDTLMVPMDSRAVASPRGTDEYVFYREGGWSWSVPYIAGMFALAAQVKPDITPELFWSTALATGRRTELPHEDRMYPFGVILDPVELMHKLQTM
jgi:hypothetical protein